VSEQTIKHNEKVSEISSLKDEHALMMKDITEQHVDWQSRTNKAHSDEVAKLTAQWKAEYAQRVSIEQNLKEQVENWRRRHDRAVADHTDSESRTNNSMSDLKAENSVLKVVSKEHEACADNISDLTETIVRLRQEVSRNRAEYIEVLNNSQQQSSEGREDIGSKPTKCSCKSSACGIKHNQSVQWAYPQPQGSAYMPVM